MAQQPRDQRTDALSADMTTLQERFDKLSDKLNNTQREVVQLRAELSGQGKRIDDYQVYVGYVGIWLAVFSVIVALAAMFGLWQASRRAADEARHWLKKNGVELLNELKDDLAKHKAATAKAAEDTQNHFATLVAGAIDKAKPFSEAAQAELRQAEVEVKDKPESHYTARDWNIRAHAAYADKKLADAALYLGKVAESPDAPVIDIAIALYNKGVVFGEMGRSEDEVAVYDEVVSRFGAAQEPALREQVGKALYNKGVVLGEMGRPEEAVAVYDEVVTRFGAASQLVLREHVATALYNKGVVLGEMGRPEDEVAVYDDMVTRFGTASELALREQVAKALVNKGVTLGQMGRSKEEVAVYDEVVTRFGTAPELALREQVAKALVNKGVRLRQMGRSEDAVAVYDEVVTRFGAASEPALREQVAGAIGNRAWVFYQKGDDAALLADSERALEISPQAAVSLCNRAFALHLLGRPRAEVMAAYALAWKVVNDKARWHDLAIEDLQEHQRKRPGAEPVAADLIAAVAALAEEKQ